MAVRRDLLRHFTPDTESRLVTPGSDSELGSYLLSTLLLSVSNEKSSQEKSGYGLLNVKLATRTGALVVC